MHQSILTKIKVFASKDWVVIQTIIEDSIKIFKCHYKQKQ